MEDLDLEAFHSHVIFTASAGTVPVIAGSMGEAVHLSGAERITLVQIARRALKTIGLADTMPIIVGVGAPNTRETILLACEVAAAGADSVMVVPPGYYSGPLQSADCAALKTYFVDIAAASPLPVILNNFPLSPLG
ncbi:hypothetical protein LTR62_005314 [Meristemomyces frigidus]|uniref:Dihydrodipicolinate synthase n=1 Tax=Meristemomyces frigidus TaxID=1508187 RepID=A0AAN7TET1_9PEZI|nr:hypothetical protein LTR62_005314 [Meristemomyces frigidus]